VGKLNKPDRSFSVSLERLAGLLRTEIKLKDKNTQILSDSSTVGSLNNSIMRIAKLLRTQTQATQPAKKRSWKVD
jgi:hypothetical protein